MLLLLLVLLPLTPMHMMLPTGRGTASVVKMTAQYGKKTQKRGHVLSKANLPIEAADGEMRIHKYRKVTQLK